MPGPIELQSSPPGASADVAVTASDSPTTQRTGFWERATLLDDMGGLRPWLANYGVTFSLQETDEYLRNLSGGLAREGAYDGLTQATVQVDTSKDTGFVRRTL